MNVLYSRIKQIIFFLPALALTPWVNILTRHGYLYIILISFSIPIFITLFNLNRKIYFDRQATIYLCCSLLFLIFSFIYHYLNLGFDSSNGGWLNFFHFYGALVILCFFWLQLLFVKTNTEKILYYFAFYFFIVSFANILLGGIVDFFSLSRNLELMHHPNYYDGTGRPYGLTGNAAVNSTMLVVAYLLIVRGSLIRNTKLSFVWFACCVLGVIIQKSGSGGAALMITLLYHLLNFPAGRKKIALILLPLFLFILMLLEFEFFRRASPTYILHILSIFQLNFEIFMNMDKNLMDFLFGLAFPLGIANSDGYILHTDFGLLFLINQMGLMYFIFINLLILRVFFKSNITIDKVIIFIVLLMGLHYQIIYFLSSSIFFSMYMVVSISNFTHIR